MKLEDVKKGKGTSNVEMVLRGVRFPKETYDYIKENNISLRKLIVAAVEELKKGG